VPPPRYVISNRSSTVLCCSKVPAIRSFITSKPISESDGFAWPQRDGLKWPHLALVDVLVR